MKKIILFSICVVFALALKAQSSADEIQYLQGIIGMKKQQYVAEHMSLNKADSAKFWKIYEDYELYRSEIVDKRLKNISQYVDNFNTLSNAKADELMKNSFSIMADLDKLWQKTYTRMAKEISPVKAVQFIQIEMYVEAMVRKAATEQLPELSKSVKK
jgi:hypothetical protein